MLNLPQDRLQAAFSEDTDGQRIGDEGMDLGRDTAYPPARKDDPQGLEGTRN